MAGQSSGADSVAYQLMAYGGDGASSHLFRGAIMESGSATDSTPIPFPEFKLWQNIYDQIVNMTGSALEWP